MKNFKRFSSAILGMSLICSFFMFTSLSYHGSATADVTGLQLGPTTQLTTNSANDIEPAWSPDGSTIVFISNRIAPTDGYDLLAINPNGTQERLLAQFTFTDTFGGRFASPAWISSTGDLLVMEYKSLHEMFRFKLAAAQADNALPVSRSISDGNSPYLDEVLFVPSGQLGISPVTFNGSRLAWAALVDPGQRIWQVRFYEGSLSSFIGNTDSAGTVVFQTSLDGRIGYPEGKTVAFSPDGSKVCIAACASGWSQGKRRDLYIIDLNTNNIQRLTTTGDQGQDNWSVAWSSQNNLAFASRPDDSSNYDLYTMNPDGTDLTRLTQTSWNEIDPEWSPDGTKLLFASDEMGNYDLYTATVNIGILDFPLLNQNAYTATINSVFDHSQTSPYEDNGIVTAFTGESGKCDPNGPFQQGRSQVNVTSHYGFRDALGQAFIVNGHYTGGGGGGNCETVPCKGNKQLPSMACTTFLFYDGHPGIDYKADCDTPVYAAVSGTVHYPTAIPGEIKDAYKFHVLEIIPDAPNDNYRVYYLHLATHISVDSKHITPCVNELPVVQEGDQVTAGVSIIGKVGSAGLSKDGSGKHLHFEVHLMSGITGIPVDPYGWTGHYSDPYTRATNIRLWK
jgi:Tol biopolymer transport system component